MRHSLIALLGLIAVLVVNAIPAKADSSTIVVVPSDSGSGIMCVVLPSGSVYCP